MSKFKVGDVVRGLGDAPWIEHKIYKVFPRTVTSLGEDAWGYNLEGITNTYTAKELVMVSPKDPTAPVEPKFKLNDRVRYAGKRDPSYPNMIGKLGVVTGVQGVDLFHVMFDGAVATLPCVVENLESAPWVDLTGGPAKPSPIVTKRLIKVDTFGIVKIDQVPDDMRGVSLRISEPGWLTAEQLREAAHILNQIAEVLEENASW